MNSTILPFDSDQLTLATGGGKGENLARLARAGFPVPAGFVIATAAYDAFVAANHLSDSILEVAGAVPADDPHALDAASAAIRSRFAAGHILPEIAGPVRDAYASLGRPPVAVRSSATAEDRPTLSFAGQQDTYLNVVGEEALLRAVIDCWSSLFTARAMAYRARNAIPAEGLSLAIVVQEMVASDTSGVLFSANPLSGRRSEVVIESTLGLGEALVSGQVEPDRTIVDTTDWRILARTLGSKAMAIHGKAGGGTVTVEVEAAREQAVGDEAILELARLGRRVADLFGTPQDVEWARAGGRTFLLQSRPITSLYPLPDGVAPEPPHVMVSFGAVQGMLDPMTPFGRDVMCTAVAGVAELFGTRYTLETQPIVRTAGERLWMDITGLIRNRIGRRLAVGTLAYVAPGAQQALRSLVEQGRWPAPGRLRVRTALRLARVVGPLLPRALRTLARPDAEREVVSQQFEQLINDVEAHYGAAIALGERVALARQTAGRAFSFILPQFVPRFGMGMATYNLLTVLAAGLPAGGHDTRAMMRGVPHNVTTAMDLALWQTSEEVRSDAPSLARFQAADAETLAADYLAGGLPGESQAAVGAFLDRYGARGLGEIDLGRPRWREDPTAVIRTLQSYLRIQDADLSPSAVYERGRATAEAEIDRLVEGLRRSRGGWLKARMARWAARRMRALVGLRESPKFAIVRLLGLIREAMLASGRELAADGVLDRPDDVFFLHMAELDGPGRLPPNGWRTLVTERREGTARERLRTQIPLLLLSDGSVFYTGVTAPGGEGSGLRVIAGSPVSPGVVEGVVHVVVDPRQADLAPGEILVCPATDPSWTPLFLIAGGVVTEVGGMMTHGAVVAREYGIPAVVGVHEATQRLKTGQRIRVDGGTGAIVILGGAPGSAGVADLRA